MTEWRKVQTGSMVHSTCLNCPPRPGMLRWRDNPDPGFGFLRLRRDGIVVAERIGGWGGGAAVRDWRRWANGESGHLWQLDVESPMSGIRYERQPSGRWLATHRSAGFA